MPRKPATKASKSGQRSPAKPPARPVPEPWVYEAEAAAAVERSTKTLANWRRDRGDVPHRLIQGRQGRPPRAQYRVSELVAWATAAGLLGTRRPPGPRPKARGGASVLPAVALSPTGAASTPGRTLLELEAALANGEDISASERQRIRDALDLRKAIHERSKAERSELNTAEMRANLVDPSALRQAYLGGLEDTRMHLERLSLKRPPGWLEDQRDLLDYQESATLRRLDELEARS